MRRKGCLDQRVVCGGEPWEMRLERGTGFDHGEPWVPGGRVLVNDSCGWEPSGNSEQVWHINDLCKEDACGM